MSLTYAELFAGAGGLSMGLEAGGFHAVAHAEIEPHARAVLRHRWPGVRLDGDVTQINGSDYAGITLLSGGSPCQDLSVAGKRAGLEGARSGLFHHQVRIWQESGAPYLLWENVYGAFSSNKGRDFATVLSTIVGAPIAVPADGWRRAGVAAGSAAVAAWRVLDLQHFGPPQRRVRVFILAARAGGVDPAQVLALSEGVCGHPSPREQSRQGAARGAGAGAASIGWDHDINPHGEVRGPLIAGNKTGSRRDGVLAFKSGQSEAAGGTFVTEGFTPTIQGGSNGSTQVPAVLALDVNGSDTAQTLRGFGHGWQGQHNSTNAVLSFAMRGREDGSVPEVSPDGIVSAIRGAAGGSTRDMVVLASGQANAEVGNGISPSLTLLHEAPIAFVGRPRRLTPLECERLMSWPDRWTATGVDEAGREYALSDTARYRLCGNGVGSVCVAWIAKRLAAAIQEQRGGQGC